MEYGILPTWDAAVLAAVTTADHSGALVGHCAEDPKEISGLTKTNSPAINRGAQTRENQMRWFDAKAKRNPQSQRI
ncbi:MAG: hypothetical protein AAB425_02430 [Bdellovibrionota bacterium]